VAGGVLDEAVDRIDAQQAAMMAPAQDAEDLRQRYGV